MRPEDASILDPAKKMQHKSVTIGAGDSIKELVRTMARQEVKRLPVIDGHTLVGVVSDADLATPGTSGDRRAGDLRQLTRAN